MISSAPISKQIRMKKMIVSLADMIRGQGSGVRGQGQNGTDASPDFRSLVPALAPGPWPPAP